MKQTIRSITARSDTAGQNRLKISAGASPREKNCFTPDSGTNGNWKTLKSLTKSVSRIIRHMRHIAEEQEKKQRESSVIPFFNHMGVREPEHNN
jgi:hypothetical protein